MSESGSNSGNGQEQGMQKQNPFEFSQDKILEDVYRTHVRCLEKCDSESLHTVASNVLNQSMDITLKVIAKVILLYPLHHRVACIKCTNSSILPIATFK